jgi:hypothetical protein
VTPTELKEVLVWCLGINYGILFIWFGIFVLVHDSLYRIHSRWFRLSAESFDAIHYAGMSIYKVGILLLNLVPWLALCITTQ